MILLDTNLLSLLIDRRAATRAPQAFAFVDGLATNGTVAIASVSLYELRRGLEKLRLRGEGRAKLVAFEKFLERTEVLPIDGPGGGGWRIAARLWAEGANEKPALRLSEGDLLVAATASYHARTLATADSGLVAGLARLRAAPPVHHVLMA